MKLCYGLLGDLADALSNGQIKQFLLQPWVAQELKARQRMSPDCKKTMRWAREVCLYVVNTLISANYVLLDGEECHRIDNLFLMLFSYVFTFPSIHSLACNQLFSLLDDGLSRRHKASTYISYDLHVLEGGYSFFLHFCLVYISQPATSVLYSRRAKVFGHCFRFGFTCPNPVSLIHFYTFNELLFLSHSFSCCDQSFAIEMPTRIIGRSRCNYPFHFCNICSHK